MSGRQNGHQLNELNGEEGAQKRKNNNQESWLTLIKGEFWHCVYKLRGNIFVVILLLPAEETV